LPLFFVSLLWLPLIALGIYRRVVARRLDGIFVVVYLLMVLMWPFPDHVQRFLLPVFPLMVVQGYLCLVVEPNAPSVRATWITAMRQVAATGYIIIFLIITVPSWLHVAKRTLEPIPVELAHFSQSRFWLRAPTTEEALKDVRLRVEIISALQEITEYVPEGECIRASHPQIVMLYSGRITFGPGEGHPCKYMYIMRSQDYYAELKQALVTGELLVSRKFLDDTPVGALVDMGSG
jgi:hypothetical protein